MKRFCLAMVMSVAALLVVSLPAAAQGGCAPAFELGGNGWCSDGVSFRAWQVEGGIELKWAVTDGDALILVERQVVGDSAAAVVVGSSDTADEFTLLDEDVATGAVYLYQVLRDGKEIGDPIEAGIGSAATDPGGASGSFKVYIPLTV
jgi:hypothetical protein